MKSKLQHTAAIFAVSLLGLGSLNTAQAQSLENVNIPDANFKLALVNHTPTIDTNSDGEISIEEAAAFEGTLDIKQKEIQSLEGLEAFVNIIGLQAWENQISGHVDFSANVKLEVLNCSYNTITSANISENTELEELSFKNNSLETIDLSANVNLKSLWLYENQLQSLDISNNTSLEHVVVDHNELTSLDVSQNVNLLTLGVQVNQITSIDVSNNPNLYVLNAWENQLTSANVANGNNVNVTFMKLQDNPNLSCIKIDAGFDPSTAQNWVKDETAMWNTECNVGINDVVLENDVKLYPNPTKDQVTVSLEGAFVNNVTVYNLQGAKVMISNNATFSVEELAVGVYYVEVVTADDKVVYQKLIKE